MVLNNIFDDPKCIFSSHLLKLCIWKKFHNLIQYKFFAFNLTFHLTNNLIITSLKKKKLCDLSNHKGF